MHAKKINNEEDKIWLSVQIMTEGLIFCVAWVQFHPDYQKIIETNK